MKLEKLIKFKQGSTLMLLYFAQTVTTIGKVVE